MKKSDSTESQSASELIDKSLAEFGDWRGDTLSRMRELIKEADPDVVEEVKWKKPSHSMLGVPVWSHDGIICTGETYKDKKKHTNTQSAAKKNPDKHNNTNQDEKTRRASDIHEGEEGDAGAFKAII